MILARTAKYRIIHKTDVTLLIDKFIRAETIMINVCLSVLKKPLSSEILFPQYLGLKAAKLKILVSTPPHNNPLIMGVETKVLKFHCCRAEILPKLNLFCDFFLQHPLILPVLALQNLPITVFLPAGLLSKNLSKRTLMTMVKNIMIVIQINAIRSASCIFLT